jgi:DNA modification methylase
VGVADQTITDHYALYCGDAMEVLRTLAAGSVHLSLYSPPFGGLYTYSSDARDLSNALNAEEFFEHYGFIVAELQRVTLPGRFSAVHCMDIPSGNSGLDHLRDFPGDVIRLHARVGWQYVARYHVWKEPLTVRNRTMTKSLSHKMLTEDSTRCSIANADYLLIFRNKGQNTVPVAHPQGLLDYAGERRMPNDVLQYRGWTGSQLENRYSHWIWRQYASAFWDDVRLDRVLPYREARDAEDEKHVHPLQLDVIDRALVLWSNPGETVLTPFMGVGSEVYGAVKAGRRGLGVELKPSYYRQAVKNVRAALTERVGEQADLLNILAVPSPPGEAEGGRVLTPGGPR